MAGEKELVGNSHNEYIFPIFSENYSSRWSLNFQDISGIFRISSADFCYFFRENYAAAAAPQCPKNEKC